MLKRLSYGLCTSLLLASAAHAEDHVVVQKNKKFSTSELVVKVGDRVVFDNQDAVVHNVYSNTPGLGFSTEVQMPGQSSTVTLDKPGTLQVDCAMHPGMKLTIQVRK